MIPLWREIQRSNFTDWKKLLAFCDIASAEAVLLKNSKFSLNLPLRLAEKIKKNDPQDPILRQFLPTWEEQEASPLFVFDPVADEKARKTAKLLHKYPGRALLVCTGACAMHCRYCFRQHFEYATQEKGFAKELEAIRTDSSLSEILLSGGDPLSLSDASLAALLGELEAIPHVKRIRFHTRFPMGIPERIDASFLHLLASCKKQIVFVLHCNHPHEFDEEIFSHLKRVQKLGIPILTQSVLLRGVNDDVEALQRLFEELIDRGMIPYYLHQLDRVQGAMHFEVPEEEGRKLMRALQTLLPGYAIPKYVREVAGESHKCEISSTSSGLTFGLMS